MLRTIRAELLKLAHPVVLVVVLAICGFIWADARTTDHYARLQTPVAVSVAASQQASADPKCASEPAQSSPLCQQQLTNALLNKDFAGNAVALGRVTNALGSWPGILRFTVHELCTGLGWLLLAVLLSLHIAGEWSSKTSGITLLATGNLRRFWTAKIASVWICLVGIALLATTVLYLTRATFNSTIGVPEPPVQQGDVTGWRLRSLAVDATWGSWSSGLATLGTAAVIWLLLIAAGVALATLLRKPLFMLVAAIAGLSLSLVVGKWLDAPRLTLLPVINQLLHLAESPFGVGDTRLWYVPDKPPDIYAARIGTSIDWSMVAVWSAGLLCAGGLLMSLSRRRRVAG